MVAKKEMSLVKAMELLVDPLSNVKHYRLAREDDLPDGKRSAIMLDLFRDDSSPTRMSAVYRKLVGRGKTRLRHEDVDLRGAVTKIEEAMSGTIRIVIKPYAEGVVLMDDGWRKLGR